jgi:putative transposase
MTSVNAKQEALLDELLQDYTNPQDILGEHGLLKRLTQRVVERMLEAELTAHLGYAPYVRHGTEEQNARHGKGHKTVQTDTGPLDLVVPRDRHGRFAPQVVPKRPRRLEGFEAKVLSLYARGLSTRESQGHLEEVYGTEVSPPLISTITDAVVDEVRAWQARPLASVYPLLYCDALFVKSRQEGPVQTKAVDLALGITMDGAKERLGLWLSESAGAKGWLSVFTALKNRGVTDGFIACVDDLQGLPAAIEAVFPHTQGQLCIVHQVRKSLKSVPWKARRAVAADLRAIYGAATLPDAEQALERFAERWDAKYPAISPSGLADWDRLTVCCDSPPAIRRAVYTTNASESLNYALRKGLQGRSAFPNDESIIKVLSMGLQHVAKKWTQPIPEWKAALNQFVILFGERVQV